MLYPSSVHPASLLAQFDLADTLILVILTLASVLAVSSLLTSWRDRRRLAEARELLERIHRWSGTEAADELELDRLLRAVSAYLARVKP